MNSSKQELIYKKQHSQNFKRQMDKAEIDYKILYQRAYYTDFKEKYYTFITQYSGKNRLNSDIFFVDGYQQEYKVHTIDRLSLCFITKIPKPKSNYIIVYFNNTSYSNSFSEFRNILELMPYQYFHYLVKIILVKPTFLEKAGRLFSFGTIPKFINSNIENANNLQELSLLLFLDKSEINKYAPRGYELEVQQKQKQDYKGKQKNQSKSGNKKDKSKTAQTQKQLTLNNNNKYHITNNTYSNTNLTTNINLNTNANPNTNAMRSQKKFQIEQYEKAQNGLPELFQILVYYFQEHPEGLQQQGIFRKSANIQEQKQAVQKMSRKHYKCLEQIDNPHIVANLIKKFLSNLLTPIIPYDMFEILMNEPNTNITPAYLNIKMKQLGKKNMTKLTTLMFLLQFLLNSVVPLSKKNKMTIESLSICFAPCLMWAKQRSMKDIAYANKSVIIMNFFMKNFEQVFGNKKDQQQIYRNSYYHHKQKTLQRVLSIASDNEQQQKNKMTQTQTQTQAQRQKSRQKSRQKQYSQQKSVEKNRIFKKQYKQDETTKLLNYSQAKFQQDLPRVSQQLVLEKTVSDIQSNNTNTNTSTNTNTNNGSSNPSTHYQLKYNGVNILNQENNTNSGNGSNNNNKTSNNSTTHIANTNNIASTNNNNNNRIDSHSNSKIRNTASFTNQNNINTSQLNPNINSNTNNNPKIYQNINQSTNKPNPTVYPNTSHIKISNINNNNVVANDQHPQPQHTMKYKQQYSDQIEEQINQKRAINVSKIRTKSGIFGGSKNNMNLGSEGAAQFYPPQEKKY